MARGRRVSNFAADTPLRFVINKKTYMNKKDYVAPSVEVVAVEIQGSLLAGSENYIPKAGFEGGEGENLKDYE